VIEQEAKGMDLVVVTSHGRKGISRFLLGSVSHAVVHHVTCPVLVLR
jgi:nucleotide-binding universal stress UspA family protein